MNLPKSVISDRRAHDRHPFRTSALLALPGGLVVQARVLDIGKGGAGLVCDVNVVEGTAVAVRMRLPARPNGSAEFEATAMVRNCTLAGSDGGFRLGLEFNPLSPSATAALHGLLP